MAQHPYTTALLFVAVATLCVFAVHEIFQFAPFIIFAVAAGICLPVLGLGPGVFAVLLAALVSDFFFVEPLLTVTRHSAVLGGYYGALAGLSRYITRKAIRR